MVSTLLCCGQAVHEVSAWFHLKVQVRVRIKMTEFGLVFEQQDLNVANLVAVTHLKASEPLVKLANNNHLPVAQLPKT